MGNFENATFSKALTVLKSSLIKHRVSRVWPFVTPGRPSPHTTRLQDEPQLSRLSYLLTDSLPPPLSPPGWASPPTPVLQGESHHPPSTTPGWSSPPPPLTAPGWASPPTPLLQGEPPLLQGASSQLPGEPPLLQDEPSLLWGEPPLLGGEPLECHSELNRLSKTLQRNFLKR